MKQCTVCKKIKPYTEFNKEKRMKDGYYNQCKECRKLIQYRVYNERRHLNKFIREHSGCMACGYNTFYKALDFHHFENKNNNISEMTRSSSMERILEEMSKCFILCSNCHRELHG